MPFELCSDRIAIIADPVETKTDSGLHVPEGYDGNKPRYGTVAHVGSGHRSEHTGEVVPIDLEVGNRVFFHKQAGEVWQFEGEEYVVMPPSSIIGVETVAAHLSVVKDG